MFDWKSKLKNKTFIVTLATAIIAFVYQILGICGVVPTVSQDSVAQVLMLIVNLLTAIGIVVNPNSDGISD